MDPTCKKTIETFGFDNVKESLKASELDTLTLSLTNIRWKT